MYSASRIYCKFARSGNIHNNYFVTFPGNLPLTICSLMGNRSRINDVLINKAFYAIDKFLNSEFPTLTYVLTIINKHKIFEFLK